MADLDWLADKAIRALRAKSTPEQSWINSKEAFLVGKSRMQVLQWIVFELDESNQAIVADSREIDIADLAAVARVLRKI